MGLFGICLYASHRSKWLGGLDGNRKAKAQGIKVKKGLF